MPSSPSLLAFGQSIDNPRNKPYDNTCIVSHACNLDNGACRILHSRQSGHASCKNFGRSHCSARDVHHRPGRKVLRTQHMFQAPVSACLQASLSQQSVLPHPPHVNNSYIQSKQRWSPHKGHLQVCQQRSQKRQECLQSGLSERVPQSSHTSRHLRNSNTIDRRQGNWSNILSCTLHMYVCLNPGSSVQ